MVGRVEGKAAIITGAGSVGPGVGNGKASAVLYAREGAKVLLVDSNFDAAEQTRLLILKEGGQCLTFKGDVTKSGDCQNMVDTCIKAFGRIDILHNNVGIEIPGGAVDMSEAVWEKILNVNLKSMFLTCKYALPHMEKQENGCIINISSVNAITSFPDCISIAYSTAKAGVIAFTREIAVQYASKGIRANAILPGLMNTPLVSATLARAFGENIEEAVKKRNAMCPMGKQGDAWDTAYAALFLASAEAKYITGVALTVDGGLTCSTR